MVLRITNLRAQGLLPDTTLVGGVANRELHCTVRLRAESRSTQPVPDAPTVVWRDELVFEDEPEDAQFVLLKGASHPKGSICAQGKGQTCGVTVSTHP